MYIIYLNCTSPNGWSLPFRLFMLKALFHVAIDNYLFRDSYVHVQRTRHYSTPKLTNDIVFGELPINLKCPAINSPVTSIVLNFQFYLTIHTKPAKMNFLGFPVLVARQRTRHLILIAGLGKRMLLHNWLLTWCMRKYLL